MGWKNSLRGERVGDVVHASSRGQKVHGFRFGRGETWIVLAIRRGVPRGSLDHDWRMNLLSA